MMHDMAGIFIKIVTSKYAVSSTCLLVKIYKTPTSNYRVDREGDHVLN